MELYLELQRLQNDLQASVKFLRKTGQAYAQAERDYKVRLSQEVLKLKDEGMKATLINVYVYGVREVADLRFKRDVAEVTYRANQENINSLKLQLRLLENQVQREYSLAGRDL